MNPTPAADLWAVPYGCAFSPGCRGAAWKRGWLSLAGLVASGFILLFTIPVNVVMAQRLAPAQAGTVSALMMGFAWGMAGMVFIPLIGFASDLFSLHGVLASLTIFPVIGFLLAWKLPR